MNIVKSAGSAFSKAGFQFKKHQPEIMVIGGVIGMVASAVMACKATPKAVQILEESKETIEKINKAAELAESGDISKEDYSKEDHATDLIGEYTRTGIGLVKTYAPAVIVGGLSIASILGGHNILRGRNLALAAAYATIDKSFKSYRGNVIERFGEAVDRELKYNLKAEQVTEKVEDPETGKAKKVKKTVLVPTDDVRERGYARLFDAACDNWNNDANLNRSFLTAAQSHFNDILQVRGYVFLSEIYRYLHYRETPECRVVGWTLNGDGDGYVDFGFDKDDMFMSGYNKDVWLDFNVDGPILDTFAENDRTLAIC